MKKHFFGSLFCTIYCVFNASTDVGVSIALMNMDFRFEVNFERILHQNFHSLLKFSLKNPSRFQDSFQIFPSNNLPYLVAPKVTLSTHFTLRYRRGKHFELHQHKSKSSQHIKSKMKS